MIHWKKIFSFFTNKETIFIIVLLLFSFFYRIWFSGLAYPDLIFDMDRYVNLANQILDGKLVADCCDKTAGYPMFIALVFRYFGESSLINIHLVQAIVELMVILLIYYISKKNFGINVACISGLLYAVNPFTASYTGLLLPEIITIFLILLLIIISMDKTIQNKVLLWLLYGLLSGLLVFVRKQFITFSILTIFYLALVYLKGFKNKVLFMIISIFGFLIINSYSLFANYKLFNKFTFLPPYLFSGYIYLLNYDVKPYPELLLMNQQYEPIYFELGTAWHSTPLQERNDVNRKYRTMFWNAFTANPIWIIWNYLSNMFMIWDRDHLFYYFDIFYPKDKIVIRIINWFYLLSGLIGGFIWLSKNRMTFPKQPLFIFFVLLVGIITFLLTLYSNEPRHSLPAFGVISIWAGYGIWELIKNISLKFVKHF